MCTRMHEASRMSTGVVRNREEQRGERDTSHHHSAMFCLPQYPSALVDHSHSRPLVNINHVAPCYSATGPKDTNAARTVPL